MIKRLLTGLCALCMMCLLCAPAFADIIVDPDEYSWVQTPRGSGAADPGNVPDTEPGAEPASTADSALHEYPVTERESGAESVSPMPVLAVSVVFMAAAVMFRTLESRRAAHR